MSKASDIQLIVSDVDGVWTDGKIIYHGEQREIKEFNVRDGLAAKLAQKAGIVIALVTSRRSPALERRARELGIIELHQGAANKLEETERVSQKLAIPFDRILYIGDDLPDLAPMSRAAISAAPADAAPEVLGAATWKLTARGLPGIASNSIAASSRSCGENRPASSLGEGTRPVL